MGGFAWVTLATNDSYSLGALVLAHSLKQAGTQQQLVVLITPGVTPSMREKLATVYNIVQEVNILDSKDEANLKLLKRPELGITFTKLHCWRLTQFDKCVFLDADTLVLQNCDELFDREELSAAPDVGWPDCFNSGVFVYRPSNETYEKLIQFALEKSSFDGGDQGLLNLYFSDWAHKDISKHLPFIYNMCSTACYSYLPAFKQFGGNAKIVHFIGATKPWLQYFDTESRRVHASGITQHLQDVLQRWWDIFCSLIHPQLSTQMTRSSLHNESSTSNPESFPTFPNQPIPTPEYPAKTEKCVWDPWEEYDKKQAEILVSKETNDNSFHIIEHEIVEPIESHNTNAYSSNAEHHQFHQHIDIENNSNIPMIPTCINNSQPLPPPPPPVQLDIATSQDPKYLETPVIEPEITLTEEPNSLTIIPNTPNLIQIESQTTSTETNKVTPTTLLDKNNEEKTYAGLAGALAQLTLGVPRTAEQNALDDHFRRQGWEVGNIDYLGRDSFENIWSKICETISAGSETVATEEPKESLPTAPVIPSEVKPQEQETTVAAEVVTEASKEPQESVVEPAAVAECKLPPKPVESDPVPSPVTESIVVEATPVSEVVQNVPASEPVASSQTVPEPLPPSPTPVPAELPPVPPISEAVKPAIPDTVSAVEQQQVSSPPPPVTESTTTSEPTITETKTPVAISTSASEPAAIVPEPAAAPKPITETKSPVATPTSASEPAAIVPEPAAAPKPLTEIAASEPITPPTSAAEPVAIVPEPIAVPKPVTEIAALEPVITPTPSTETISTPKSVTAEPVSTQITPATPEACPLPTKISDSSAPSQVEKKETKDEVVPTAALTLETTIPTTPPVTVESKPVVEPASVTTPPQATPTPQPIVESTPTVVPTTPQSTAKAAEVAPTPQPIAEPTAKVAQVTSTPQPGVEPAAAATTTAAAATPTPPPRKGSGSSKKSGKSKK